VIVSVVWRGVATLRDTMIWETLNIFLRREDTLYSSARVSTKQEVLSFGMESKPKG
jgi:hypothetical protein